MGKGRVFQPGTQRHAPQGASRAGKEQIATQGAVYWKKSLHEKLPEFICLERVTLLKNTLLIHVGIPCVGSSCQLLKFPDGALDFILPVKWLDVAIVSFIPRRK